MVFVDKIVYDIPAKSGFILFEGIDNHESHCSLEAVTLAKNNGIILLTLPPHTSHKLQPLDRTVFGPYKKYCNNVCGEWLLNHPGQPITIYNVAELAGNAYPLAFIPKNILSGFRVSGIWPLYENIFGDDEYLCSSVTDREDPEDPTAGTRKCLNDYEKHPMPSTSKGSIDDALPSTSKQSTVFLKENSPSTIKLNLEFTTPEEIRPYPKAKKRKVQITIRKKIKSGILTDTPEKDDIEQSFNERQRKKNLQKSKQVVRNITPKKKVTLVETSDEADTYSTDCGSSEISDEFFEPEEFEEQALDISSLKQGDYVLAKILGKKTTHFYVAEIISVDVLEFQVKYLKRFHSTNKFLKESQEIFAIDKENIVLSLPRPTLQVLSERQRNMLTLGVDFSSYKVE